MHIAGRMSWQVRLNDDLAMHHGLYVRDALALSVPSEPEIGLLSPRVPVRVPEGVDRAAVAAEWPGWWADVLEHAGAEGSVEHERHFAEMPVRPGSPALAACPAIAAALAAFNDEFARYLSACKRFRWSHGGMDVTNLVRDKETVLGREAPPFVLVVDRVPVEGFLWYRRSRGHVLVSPDFADDPARWWPAFGAVIDDLMTG